MSLTTSHAYVRPSWGGALAGYFVFRRATGAIAELDGLRGLAILLVLLRHATLPFQNRGEPILPLGGWDAATPMLNGWIGVDLFFVLSGFLIADHIARLHDRFAGRVPWRTYLLKRFLRIAPAYIFVLAIVAAGLIPYFHVAPEALGFRIAYHLLFLQDYLRADIVVAFWSLGVEEKFYLAAPFLMLAVWRIAAPRRKAAFLLALIGGAILLRTIVAATTPGVDAYHAFFPVFRSPFHMVVDGLLLGVLCAVIRRHQAAFTWLSAGRRPDLLFWVGAVTLGWLLFAEPLMAQITWFDKTLQPTLIPAAFAAMTLALLFGGGPQPLFRAVSLFFLARISYSLYLIHMPLIAFSVVLVGRDAGLGGFLPVFATLSILAALAIHYAVEKPFLIWKDRL